MITQAEIKEFTKRYARLWTRNYLSRNLRTNMLSDQKIVDMLHARFWIDEPGTLLDYLRRRLGVSHGQAVKIVNIAIERGYDDKSNY